MIFVAISRSEAMDFTELSTAFVGTDGVSYLTTLLVVVVAVVMMSQILKQFQPSSRKEPILANPRDGEAGKMNVTVDKLASGQVQTLGFWVYVSDWDQKWSSPKQVLNVPGLADQDAVSPFTKWQSNSSHSNPLVMLQPFANKMAIRVSTMTPADATGAATASNTSPWVSDGGAVTYDKSGYFVSTQTCDIDNIPLQRWVSVALVQNGSSLDIQRDGKLQRSCVLDNVTVNTLPQFQITPDTKSDDNSTGSGFRGRVGRTFRDSRVQKSEEVLAWHNAGPGGASGYGFLSLLGLDRIFMSQTNLDGQEQGVNFSL